MAIEIMLDTGTKNAVTEPEFLEKMAALEDVRQRASADVDDLERARHPAPDAQGLHENRPEYYTIPETREEASQYLLLYEMGGGANKESSSPTSTMSHASPRAPSRSTRRPCADS